MSELLYKARHLNTLAKRDFNNSDKVLAVILHMLNTKKKLSAMEITKYSAKCLSLSETNIRKVMSGLRSSGLIIKENKLISINPKYLK
jgi:biotin operon repressor